MSILLVLGELLEMLTGEAHRLRTGKASGRPVEKVCDLLAHFVEELSLSLDPWLRDRGDGPILLGHRDDCGEDAPAKV